jgi:hypothetical protein
MNQLIVSCYFLDPEWLVMSDAKVRQVTPSPPSEQDVRLT